MPSYRRQNTGKSLMGGFLLRAGGIRFAKTRDACRFSEKIMLKQKDRAPGRFNQNVFRSHS